ncbi:MAG: hypothetical protein WBE72_01165 [Terracidiphilus sp.]
MQIGFVELTVGAAAAWRITHLLQAEDGPWDALARLRRLAGNGVWGKMLDCFNCTSVWVALPMAAAMGATYKERLFLWPALSGAAILLERATNRTPHYAPLAEWHEVPEKESPEREVL